MSAECDEPGLNFGSQAKEGAEVRGALVKEGEGELGVDYIRDV